MREPRLIWFTGLSGSGKTTLANVLAVTLKKYQTNSIMLDGDLVRCGLCSDLGYTLVDRTENLRRVSEVSKLMLDAGFNVIGSFISPLNCDRESIKAVVGSNRYFEVYVNTPLDICENRDVKGLYSKARAGLLNEFTGITSPYETPLCPDFIADTVNHTASQLVDEIIKLAFNVY